MTTCETCHKQATKRSKYCRRCAGEAKYVAQILARKRYEASSGQRQENCHILTEAENYAAQRERIKLCRLVAVVVVRPANTSFARYAVKFDSWQTAPGRISKVIGSGKVAIAQSQAYAQTLKRYGLTATAIAIAE